MGKRIEPLFTTSFTTSRALLIAAVVSIALCLISILEHRLIDVMASYTVFFSVIVPAIVFFLCLAPLAFFATSLTQRFVWLGTAVVLYCVPPWVVLVDTREGLELLRNGPMILMFRFIFSAAGFASVAAVLIYSIVGLGPGKSSQRIEDEDVLIESVIHRTD